MEIILASASPRRSDLLKQVGINFKVEISTVEEKITHTDPIQIVKSLSMQKAYDVFSKQDNNVIVIGADTIVVKDNEIMGKPIDKIDAFKKLKKLQNSFHSVYTGVTVYYKNNNIQKTFSFVEESKVYMYSMTDKQINDYIDTNEPMDKAGAYGIQGICALYIKKIHGDYNNIVGLPISRLYNECLKKGIDLKEYQ